MTSINSRLSLHYGHGAFIAASILPTAHPLTLIHRSAWKVNSPRLDFRLTEFSEVQVQGVRGFLAPAADRFARRPPPQGWQRWSLARRAFRTIVIRASPPSRHG